MNRQAARSPRLRPTRLPNRRLAWGVVVAGGGLTFLTAVLVPVRGDLSLASISLLYLVPVVATAVIGGVWPALVAAVAADLLVNFFFIPPYHTLAVENRDNTIVLVVYIFTAAVVAVAVEIAARQQANTARGEAESTMLAQASARPVAEDSLAQLLENIRSTFRMDTIALVEQSAGSPRTVARVGPPSHGNAVLDVPAAADVRLIGWGPEIFAEDRRVLERLAGAAARTHETQRLAAQAAHAADLAEVDKLRSALLTAVGHDLRTPLTGIKAAVSSLRQTDVKYTDDEEAELLATIEQSTDRLDALIDNLLSMSRLQAGALTVDLQPLALDAVVAQALLNTSTEGRAIEVQVPDDLPQTYADPGLLERVIANLVANALAASPPDRPICLNGHRAGQRVDLHIIDYGPGIPPAIRHRMFEPFQRLDDRASSAGLGLGLAIALGFTEAMDGTLAPEDTPGGGLTMTVSLPTAPRSDVAR